MAKKLNGSELRAKGYNVLPVKARTKACYMPGWDRVDDWEGEAPGLGLNLVGLVMVDFDIDDSVDFLIEDLVALSKLDQLYDAPWRYRHNSPRVAILMRCEAPEHIRFTTPKWKEGKVEFKIGRGEFMFGWGVHPSGAGLGWTWEDKMVPNELPHNFPAKKDLPLVTYDALRLWCDRMQEHLLKLWGKPLKKAYSRSGWETVDDLQMDMQFKLPSGRLATLEGLYSGPGTSQVVNLTPWRPDSDSDGGHITHSYIFDGPIVTDFVAGVVHTLPDPWAEFDDPIGWPKGVPQTPQPINVEVVEEAAEAVFELSERVKRLVHVRELSRYIYRDDPSGLSMAKDSALAELTARQRSDIAHTIQTVERQTWDPAREPLSIFHDDRCGHDLHNSFAPPWHPDESGNTAAFHSFFKKLIPDDHDREIVWLWLAHKTQRPDVRGFSVVLVGPEGGGKGTLWGVIADLFEEHTVANVSGIGPIYDAKYDDVKYRKLFILIDEVAADDVGWRGRKLAHERLKGFCEPQSKWALLNIKGGKQVQAKVCATVGIASNNLDALPLSRKDRRFFVTHTGGELSPPEVRCIQDWREQAPNIGALWAELRRVDLSGFNVMRAPDSQTKVDMAEANESELDNLRRIFIDLATQSGGYYTAKLLNSWLDGAGLDYKERQILKGSINGKCPSRVVWIDDKSVRIRITRPQSRVESGYVVKERLEVLTQRVAEYTAEYMGVNPEG